MTCLIDYIVVDFFCLTKLEINPSWQGLYYETLCRDSCYDLQCHRF